MPAWTDATIADKREILFGSHDLRTAPLNAVRNFSQEVDRILKDVFHSLFSIENVCLIALGGYGRRELCPYSDVDILVLHDDQNLEKIAAMVRRFWDTGLTMGCVVRTIDQCASILGQDIASDTALLENSFITGDRELFERFRRDCIIPYFERKKRGFIEEICRTLRSGLLSSGNSLFRVEPDLKNGICTLRDCQRMLWAERVRRKGLRFNGLHDLQWPQAKSLESDYAFLIGLRIELHMLCKRRMDILEIDLQPDLAEKCAYGAERAGRLMEDFFKTVRNIRLHILSFLERDLSGKNIWSIVRKRVSANPIGPGISVLDGIVFSNRKKLDDAGHPLWMMKVFKSALVHQATLSVELRNKLRRYTSELNSHDFHCPEVAEVFREILTRPEPVGPVMQMMHETGVLGKLIPPFQVLNCKVEYDSYHEFTIDQHILLALSSIDAMVRDTDAGIRSMRNSVKSPFLLRATALFHDLGKSQPGDHAQNGAIIVENICGRLGFSEEEIERLKFLVYHHLDLSDLSFKEPEDGLLRQFAKEVADKENLDLLHLLTVADIRSVGHNAWTHWKAFQLEQLHNRIRKLIDHPKGNRRDITKYNPLIYESSYFLDILPEDRALHRKWLSRSTSDLSLHHDQFTGFERITVCGSDRPGFLCDLIGCITSEGYNILNAHIYSTKDGKVLDIFYLEPPDIPAITWEEKKKNIEKKWRKIERKEATPDDLVADRIRKYPLPPLRRTEKPALQVRISNPDSSSLTIAEIDATDNFGLLHKIIRCFHENNINIVSARLSTRADLAVDIFYICDADKNRIIDETKLENLKNHLIAALTE
jgi:[protein-PII] uridylyltransferase